MAKKRITDKPGLFGTVYYYDEKGNPVGKSRPGLFGETRVYTDQKGQHAGKSRPGFLAKEVFTDADHNHVTTYEGLCGDIHYQNGVPVGQTKPGLFGKEYTTLDADSDAESFCAEDMPEEWEEAEEETFWAPEEASYKVTGKTIVKNLQLLLLCLVICLVMFCIYGIVRLN